MTRKLLAILIAALMVLALVPLGAMAQGDRPSIKIRPIKHRDENTVTVTLTAGDVWEDGTGYQMLLDADANAYGSTIPETGGLTSSGNASAATYAEFEYKIPENADGTLTTTNIVIENSVTITIPAGTYDWCITNPTPNDRVWIASEKGTAGGGRADDYVFEAGHTYEFVVSMGSDGHDRVDLVLDGVEVEEPLHEFPEGCIWGYYFENDYELDYLYILDMDGDDDYWGIATSDDLSSANAYEGDQFAISASYGSSGALTPDNWLIFTVPTIPSTGMTVTFYARGYSTSWYKEHFAAYVITDADIEDENFPNNLTSLTPVIPETQTTNAWTQYTADLSAYAGQDVLFAIRHFNCTDQYYLLVDQVEFWGTPDEEPPTPVTHTLTIEYVYDGGGTAYTTYTATLEEGDTYNVPSPEIEGYTPDIAVVTGTMGGADITVTVTYIANEEPPVVTLGDVDCDGDVDFDDVTLLNAYLLNAAEVTDQGLLNANVNGDSRVSSADVVALSKLILGNE